jgi:hypothetical protein
MEGCGEGSNSEVDALVEAGQLEGVLDAQLVQHLLRREVVDAEDDLPGHPPELLRQLGEGLLGQDGEVVQRRRAADLQFTHRAR